jgi:hypothetical protein
VRNRRPFYGGEDVKEHLPSPNRWLRSMVDTFGSGFLPQPQLKNFCNRTQQGE